MQYAAFLGRMQLPFPWRAVCLVLHLNAGQQMMAICTGPCITSMQARELNRDLQGTLLWNQASLWSSYVCQAPAIITYLVRHLQIVCFCSALVMTICSGLQSIGR